MRGAGDSRHGVCFRRRSLGLDFGRRPVYLGCGGYVEETNEGGEKTRVVGMRAVDPTHVAMRPRHEWGTRNDGL